MGRLSGENVGTAAYAAVSESLLLKAVEGFLVKRMAQTLKVGAVGTAAVGATLVPFKAEPA